MFFVFMLFYFYILKSMLFFVVVNAFVFFADVGPVHPTGLSRHVCVVWDDEMDSLKLDVSLWGVEINLTGLTAHVSMIDVEDLPLRMQWHVTRMPSYLVQLFKRVDTIVLCYQDVHGDISILY